MKSEFLTGCSYEDYCYLGYDT